jgi:hypothetical protein
MTECIEGWDNNARNTKVEKHDDTENLVHRSTLRLCAESLAIYTAS